MLMQDGPAREVSPDFDHNWMFRANADGSISTGVMFGPGGGTGLPALPISAFEQLLLVDTRNRIIAAIEAARHNLQKSEEDRLAALRQELAALEAKGVKAGTL